MVSTASTLRCALLYGISSQLDNVGIYMISNHFLVPGASKRMLEKSRSLNVDCVSFDLEDSVAPSLKATARTMVRQHLSQERFPGIRDHAVRINAVDSGLALQDLTELVGFGYAAESHSICITLS